MLKASYYISEYKYGEGGKDRESKRTSGISAVVAVLCRNTAAENQAAVFPLENYFSSIKQTA